MIESVGEEAIRKKIDLRSFGAGELVGASLLEKCQLLPIGSSPR
jgi:hypothetical protein